MQHRYYPGPSNQRREILEYGGMFLSARMLGPDGNPRMDSIIGILKVLQKQEQIKLRAQF
jgi:hypothetical protein